MSDLKNSGFLDVGLPLQDTVGITTVVRKSAPMNGLREKTLMNKTFMFVFLKAKRTKHVSLSEQTIKTQEYCQRHFDYRQQAGADLSSH